MTSCTSTMSISWRVSNASSIAIRVGVVMALMFKGAILIETIRSNCGVEWASGPLCFLYFVLIRLRCSRSTPVRSRRIPALFSILSFYFGKEFVPDSPF